MTRSGEKVITRYQGRPRVPRPSLAMLASQTGVVVVVVVVVVVE
jgi:hypothetical protein